MADQAGSSEWLSEIMKRFPNCKIEMAQILLDAGIHVDAVNGHIFRCSIIDGNIDLLKFMLETCIDVRNSDNEPLAFAVDSGHLNIVQTLIENGIPVRADDDNALHCAIESGRLEILRAIAAHYSIKELKEVQLEYDSAELDKIIEEFCSIAE